MAQDFLSPAELRASEMWSTGQPYEVRRVGLNDFYSCGSGEVGRRTVFRHYPQRKESRRNGDGLLADYDIVDNWPLSWTVAAIALSTRQHHEPEENGRVELANSDGCRPLQPKFSFPSIPSANPATIRIDRGTTFSG